jgi:hypothetical protein
LVVATEPCGTSRICWDSMQANLYLISPWLMRATQTTGDIGGPMRTITVIATVLAGLSLSASGAEAAPWCAQYSIPGGATNCGF